MVFHWLRMEDREMLELKESVSEEMSVRMEELGDWEVARFSGCEGRGVSREEGESRFLDGVGVGVIGVTDFTGVIDVADFIGVSDGTDFTGVIDAIDFTGVIDTIDFTGVADTTDFTDTIGATSPFLFSTSPFLPLLPLSFCLSKKEGMGVTTEVTCMWVLLASTADRNTSWKATNNTSSLNNRICFLSVLKLMS